MMKRQATPKRLHTIGEEDPQYGEYASNILVPVDYAEVWEGIGQDVENYGVAHLRIRLEDFTIPESFEYRRGDFDTDDEFEAARRAHDEGRADIDEQNTAVLDVLKGRVKEFMLAYLAGTKYTVRVYVHRLVTSNHFLVTIRRKKRKKYKQKK